MFDLAIQLQKQFWKAIPWFQKILYNAKIKFKLGQIPKKRRNSHI